ncbi:MAG TPA: DUF4139 domain-containing protein [Polyangiaceae bacterium]|nr:DUF4139 domain-containing protein [Polyangiaceae bacterium]
MKLKQSICGFSLGAALLSLGAQSALADAKPPANPAAVAHSTSSADDRKTVSITVYNQNFGLVREVRELPSLGSGKVELEFRDVAANIQPETVSIKAVGAGAGFSVLEQNYRYDLLTPQTLLEKYVGKRVRAYRYHEQTAKEDVVDADLLSVEGGPVLKFNNEITFGYPARLAFPQVPDNLIAKPTLVWLVDSAAAKQTVEVTYLTQNLNWSADYVLVVDDAEKKGDLNGWVTLVNQSGTSYKNAELKLVAGDVNRVERQVARPGIAYAAKAAPAAAPGFQEQALFEYHLYSLQRPTNVLQNEQKQVSLLSAPGIGVNKKLIFFGEQYWFRGQYGEVLSNQKVGAYLDIQNSEQNHLGMPLPKGTLRVYKADKSGAKQFVGEDTIDHTPRDEKFRVKMGESFDVVGDRKQTEWRELGQCASESSWEIEIRNHKDTAVEVEDYEPIGGDWTILSSSQAAEKKDANTFTFTLKVPARGKTKVNYKVRVKWC